MKAVWMMISLMLVLMLGACATSDTSDAGDNAATTTQDAAVTKTVKLNVEGMTCGSCVNSVQTALTERDGVSDCSVSLDENMATVTYDPGKVNESDLLAAVEKTGYRATVRQ